MALLLDSLWRAAAYCMLPRVILLSLAPLLLLVVLAAGLGYWYWDAAVAAARVWLSGPGWLDPLWAWLHSWGLERVTEWVAPMLVVVLITPVLVMASLLIVATMMTPALVSMVAQRRFAALECHHGGSFWASVLWSLGSTLMALVALVLSIPLWLVPPLVLILPPLIWGWLTYRVMTFDALSEHASKTERMLIMRRYRAHLLGMGVLTGYLGAAPSIVWASGVVFAAAFVVLVPLAIWIYTLVFAFSSLWYAHFCLQALAQLRAESARVAVTAPEPPTDGGVQP